MIRQFLKNPWTRRITGFSVGMSLCGLLALSILHFGGYFERAHLRWLETRLHAAAAQTGGSMAIATGPMETGVDGLFVLDNVSGDLTCGVLNPRTGQLAGLFRRNVAADLGVEAGKQPKYLLVTGAVEPKQLVSNIRPALSVVYVADSTSGKYAGYVMPWSAQAITQNLTIVQNFIPIGGGSARNVALE